MQVARVGAPSSKPNEEEEAKALLACTRMVVEQKTLLEIPEDHARRFQGKSP
jgi:hypothetical protein